MTDPQRRPSGRVEGGFFVRAFVGARCSLGSTLVVPMRTLWDCYRDWCAEQGVEASSADLRRTLDDAPWAEVVERPQARGRLKTVVRGVGVRPHG